ncbi:MAG: N-acetyl sugar amidotransferase [Bacteroidota bacterium]
MSIPYQICNRCIMDTTDTEIVFDEKGNCNHCNNYYKLAPLYVHSNDNWLENLYKLADEIKKNQKNSEYDCIVGVSGGVDSTYVAYWAKKLELRVLTVHLDNGWNSELAVKNIENIVTKLNFDYQTWVIDWEEFKDLQISFLKASVANAEIPTDHSFLAAIYRLCDKYNIKYILSGSNFVTEGILPKSWGYNAKDLKHLNDIHNKFGEIPFKTYPRLGFLKEFYYTYYRKIKMIRLLNHLPYNKQEAMELITKELGWQYYGGKHYESIFTRFFQSYILPKKFNIDKRRAHLSTLICSNQTTRLDALEEIKKPPYPDDLLQSDKEYVIKKLGLSNVGFEEIMNAPIKPYKVYANNEDFLNFAYKIYYKIKGIKRD